MKRLSLIWVLLFWPNCDISAQSKGGDAVPPQKATTTWFCDPVNGSTPTNAKDTGKGDGAKERPWGSFESVVKARLVNGADPTKGKIHAGDTIKLMSGDHGRVSFQSTEYQNTETITVEAADGESPTISQLFVKLARNWTFRGITFQPNQPIAKGFMIFRAGQVSGFTIDECRFQSIDDATAWTDADCETKCAKYGLHLEGEDNTVTNCRFYALENCLYVDGSSIFVDQNRFEFFVNDGIEHQASDLKITRNRITDQYNLASNKFHHDGMQGWNYTTGVLHNIVIDSNFVARSTGKYKSIPPVSDSQFQGISIFDGAFSDVTISNNIVMSPAYHAISLCGCVDSTIEQNTVIYQGMTPDKPCWIGVFVSKPRFGSIAPNNITIRNNIAPTYALPKTGVELENNYSFKVPNKPWNMSFVIVDPAKTFVRYEPAVAQFDLQVRDDSPAAGELIPVRKREAGARQ